MHVRTLGASDNLIRYAYHLYRVHVNYQNQQRTFHLHLYMLSKNNIKAHFDNKDDQLIIYKSKSTHLLSEVILRNLNTAYLFIIVTLVCLDECLICVNIIGNYYEIMQSMGSFRRYPMMKTNLKALGFWNPFPQSFLGVLLSLG